MAWMGGLIARLSVRNDVNIRCEACIYIIWQFQMARWHGWSFPIPAGVRAHIAPKHS